MQQTASCYFFQSSFAAKLTIKITRGRNISLSPINTALPLLKPHLSFDPLVETSAGSVQQLEDRGEEEESDSQLVHLNVST